MRRYKAVPLLIFLSLTVPVKATEEEICFPLSRKEITPPDFTYAEGLSRSGRWLLYSLGSYKKIPLRRYDQAQRESTEEQTLPEAGEDPEERDTSPPDRREGVARPVTLSLEEVARPEERTSSSRLHRPPINPVPAAAERPTALSLEEERLENLNLPEIPEILTDGEMETTETPAEITAVELSSVHLFDLENLEGKEFLPPNKLESRVFYRRYGFSPDGSLVWGLPFDGGLKIQYLSGPKAGQTLFSLEGRMIFHIEPMKKGEDWLIIDGGSWSDWDRLMSETDSNSTGSFESDETPVNDRRGAEDPSEFFRLMDSTDLVLRVWDPVTLKTKEEKTLPLAGMKCHDVNLPLNRFFYVQKDGSLWGIPLKGPGEAEMWFGPPSDFDLVWKNFFSSHNNCAFFGKSHVNILRLPEEEGLLIRSLRERREFVRPLSALLDNARGVSGRTRLVSYRQSLHRLDINYPFSVRWEWDRTRSLSNNSGDRYGRHRIYHIPEGRFLTKPEEDILFVTDRQNRLALQVTAGREGRVFQAVFQPFDPARRKVILEMPVGELCKRFFPFRTNRVFNRDRNRAFVSSVWGDIFVIDVETGKVSRFFDFFRGPCFFAKDITPSGDTIQGWIFKEDQKVYAVHKFQKTCVNPSPTKTSLTGELLKRMAETEDPTDMSFLQSLTAVLQKEDIVRDHPQALDNILSKILLKSPALYLDLHRKHPALGDLPPSASYGSFPPELQEKLRESARDLLEMTGVPTPSHPVFRVALSPPSSASFAGTAGRGAGFLYKHHYRIHFHRRRDGRSCFEGGLSVQNFLYGPGPCSGAFRTKASSRVRHHPYQNKTELFHRDFSLRSHCRAG